MVNKNEIEDKIYKSLQAIRIKGINVVNQIRKKKYSHFINIGKIDMNILNDEYGYDKNYLIQLINNLDYVNDLNLKHISE